MKQAAAGEIPGLESWVLYSFHILPALFFLCSNGFCMVAYINRDWTAIWPILLWTAQIINLVTLLLPVIWTAMVWHGRARQGLFFGVTLSVVLGMWAGNLGVSWLFWHACPTCYFG